MSYGSVSLDECLEKNKFSGHVLIMKDAEVIAQRTRGYADKENNRLINDSTLFNISSIGKLLTRIAILQLVQEGKLSFDDKVAKWGVDLSNDKENEVTIKHLLTHRSGLGDYYASKAYKKSPADYVYIDKIMEIISAEEIKFKPGTETNYSNSGYIVLGAILQKVSGKSYEALLKEKLFLPLELSHTHFIYSGNEVTNRAWGYKLLSGGKIKQVWDGNRLEEPTSAGNMYSTIGDLMKVSHSLLTNDRLLKSEYRAILFNNFEMTETDFNRVKAAKAVVGYVGGNPGWSAKISFLLTSGYTIITLCNFEEMAVSTDECIRKTLPHN